MVTSFLIIVKDPNVLFGGLMYFALIIVGYGNYALSIPNRSTYQPISYLGYSYFAPHRNQYLPLHPHRNPAALRPTQRRRLFLRPPNRRAFRRHSPPFPIRLNPYPPRLGRHYHPSCR